MPELLVLVFAAAHYILISLRLRYLSKAITNSDPLFYSVPEHRGTNNAQLFGHYLDEWATSRSPDGYGVVP